MTADAGAEGGLKPHSQSPSSMLGPPPVAIDKHKLGQSVRSVVTNDDAEEVVFPETPKGKEEDDGKSKEAIQPVPFYKLFSTADAQDKALMVLATIGAVGNGALMPLFALVFGDFIDAFGNPDGVQMDAVSRLALKFLYLGIAAAVASYMEASFWMYSGNRQANRLRLYYLQGVLRQDVSFFDVHATTGGLLQGLNEDSLDVQNAISEKLGAFMHHITTFITGFIIAFVRGWEQALVMLGCMPFLAIIGALLAKRTTQMAQIASESYTEAASIAQQSISQIRTVAAYNQEERAMRSYERALDGPRKLAVKHSLASGLSLGGVQFVIYGTYAVGLFFGAYRVAAGAYTGGQVLQVIVCTLIGGFSLGQAGPNIQYFAKGRVAGARMFKVIERVPEIDVGPTGNGDHSGVDTGRTQSGKAQGSGKQLAGSGKGSLGLGAGAAAAGGKGEAGALVELPEKVHGLLELRNVDFAYPARPDVLVFRNFSLTVPAAYTVALVGSSGSGKSTVVGLVERFYDPLAGQVLLDGVDLRNLPLKWLRSQMGLVSQEPTLFATTIFENIMMGKPGANIEEVEAAARAANAHSFVAALPLGYNTQVGERGTQLSGGQKQRIAIARAILKNPKILLLDEATSALDTRSERLVQDALDRMVVGRTTVVVAHRLSTIKGADTIAVVSGGQVVEQGTHEELLRDAAGAYTNLVKLQMQAQEQQEGEEEEEEGAEGGVADPDAVPGLAYLKQSASEHEHTDVMPMAAGAGDRDGPSLVDASAHNGVRSAQVSPFGVPQQQQQHLPGQSAGPDSLLLAAPALAGSAPGSGLLPMSMPPQGAVVVTVPATQASGGAPAPVSKQASAPLTGSRQGSADIGAAHDPTAKGKVKEVKEEAYKVPLSRLLAYNKPEWHLSVLGSLASVGAGVQHPAFAFVIASMISIFYTTDMSQLKSDASFYCWMFFVIGVGAFLCVLVQQVSFGVMGYALARRLRAQLLGAILRQEVAWFDDEAHSSGKLSANLSADAAHVRGAVGDVAGVVLSNLSTLAVGYLIAFAYDWRMALLITGVLPFVIASALIHIKFHSGFASDADKFYANANQTVTEAFSSIRVIHAYNLQGFVVGLYKRLARQANTSLVRQSVVSGLGFGYSNFVMFGMYGLIVYFMGNEIERGWVDFGDSLKAFMAILLAAMGMAQASVGFPDIALAKDAIQRIFPIIDRKPLIDSSSEEGIRPNPKEVRGEIEFRGVRFAYPARPSIIIFKNFSLQVPAGLATALVGESGSGKSTVVGLVERFYDPLAGQVLLDGVDLRQYHLRSVRALVGLVSQEPLLFSGTVAENIMYGRPNATQEEIEEAAETANAKAFINSLPERYNTKVGEGGVQLSGGQKQRIAIARAVIKNPKVLLLDEATSALDARSERLVQSALDRIMQGRTSLVIAHRLSTIRNAAQIAVVYRGIILEKGTHEELMAIPKGNYARLVAAQNKGKGPSMARVAAASMARAAAAATAAGGSTSAPAAPVLVRAADEPDE